MASGVYIQPPTQAESEPAPSFSKHPKSGHGDLSDSPSAPPSPPGGSSLPFLTLVPPQPGVPKLRLDGSRTTI